MTTRVPPPSIFCARHKVVEGYLRCEAFGDQPIPARIFDDLDPHTSPDPRGWGLTFLPFPDACHTRVDRDHD